MFQQIRRQFGQLLEIRQIAVIGKNGAADGKILIAFHQLRRTPFAFDAVKEAGNDPAGHEIPLRRRFCRMAGNKKDTEQPGDKTAVLPPFSCGVVKFDLPAAVLGRDDDFSRRSGFGQNDPALPDRILEQYIKMNGRPTTLKLTLYYGNSQNKSDEPYDILEYDFR